MSRCKKIKSMGVVLFLYCAGIAGGGTLYVDDNAAPGGGGSSWADAYKYLQDALAAATSSDEIRVAQGTYKPDQGGSETPGNRNATFQLNNGVALLGGYAGPGTADPDARDPNMYETILSGDLSGNDAIITDPQDLPDEPTRAENSLHVVTGSGTDETAVIDGFTITKGNPHWPTILGFLDPKAHGGGMYNYSGSPTVIDCLFTRNSADWHGGGMVNWENSNPTIIRCRFTENSTNDFYDSTGYVNGGGGMLNAFDSSPILAECVFLNNWAIYGGGIHNYDNCSPKASQCDFSENTAGLSGGGMGNDLDCNPILDGCTFSSNTAAEYGGGMANGDNCNPILTDCIFSGNTAVEKGGGIYSSSSNPTLSNCILWGDAPQEIYMDGGTATVSYSDIQGGWLGTDNIDEDPYFADPNNGDFHLKSQAGHWDSDNLTWVQDEITSLCIDAGDPTSDYCGELWPHGGRINMGAYGGTAEASMSLDDSKGCIADLNCNGKVDIADFNLLSGKWLLEQYLLKEDMDRNGRICLPDAAILCTYWLWEE